MTHSFDKEYWDQHWGRDEGERPVSMAVSPPNPHLVREVGGLAPGTALDAGCGAGTEALWLAAHGWQVTAVDIAAEPLDHAAEKARALGQSAQVEWVEADLSRWDPGTQFDLVSTHYAHPATPQLEFYDRIASRVAPGGTLLIVGHLHTHDTADGQVHGPGRPPAEASVTAASVVVRLGPDVWEIATAEERHRTTAVDGDHGDHGDRLSDVVVRAVRR